MITSREVSERKLTLEQAKRLAAKMPDVFIFSQNGSDWEFFERSTSHCLSNIYGMLQSTLDGNVAIAKAMGYELWVEPEWSVNGTFLGWRAQSVLVDTSQAQKTLTYDFFPTQLLASDAGLSEVVTRKLEE